VKTLLQALDGGNEKTAFRLADALEVALASHRETPSLLRRAGIEESTQFWDSSSGRLPDNFLPYSGLIAVMVHGKDAHLIPRTSQFKETRRRMLSFSAWWDRPILDDRRSHVFTRKSLVAAMARFERDPTLLPYADETYLSLVNSNFTGWASTEDGIVSAAFDSRTGHRVQASQDGEPIGRADLVSLRVIAEEFVYSIVNNYH